MRIILNYGAYRGFFKNLYGLLVIIPFMKAIPSVLCILSLVIVTILTCGCTSNAPMGLETQEAEVVSVSESGPTPGSTLLVYCGAGMRGPMEEIASLYEEKEGTRIEYTFGGSAQLLSQIELYQRGDLYMPGALSYIESAIEKGYVDKTEDIVYHVLAIAVPKGNPANISTVEDLIRPGVRVAIGEPSGPAVGKASQKMFEKNELWDAVQENIVVKSGTVNELLVYVAMNQADAALIWMELYNPESMDLIEIPKDVGRVDIVPIGTLTFSENKEDAEKFLNFVASDEGKEIYEKHGFEIYPLAKYGDA